jgi:hypothetical protein
MQHMLPYAAFHVGRRNKPVRQIRDEAAICVAVQEFLDALGPNPGRELGDPDAAYDVVVEHLARVKPEELHRLRTSPRTPPVRRVFPVAWRLLGLGVSVLPALPLFYAVLLYKEWTDREETYGTLPRHTRLLLEREDFQVQNQLTHLVEVKPGLFRQLTLRAVLWSIDTLARYYYNQGDLGGLSTIHYARWVLIDGGKRLLFFSNYDGSWERYLGDFIDQAHVGLTAVWSNTKGFPKTFSLIGRGAKDEERFKAWTRAHQIQSELWYSAYPSSTVPNIERNSAICDGIVTRPETRDARARWLSLL